MTEKYITNTASLKTTIADIRILNSNKIDAKNMLLNGKNIEELWGLNLPQDYPKLVTRMKIPEDSDYALCDDKGKVVYISFADKITDWEYQFENSGVFIGDIPSDLDFPNLVNGSYMFYNSNLKSFSGNLDSLNEGRYMFCDCTNLTSFSSALPSLINGYEMFSNCRLDADSVEKILTSITPLSSSQTLNENTETSKERFGWDEWIGGNLHLGIQESAAAKFTELTGLTPNATEFQTVSFKEWTIYVKIN